MSVDPFWAEYYRDEMDAAWLYRAMARFERDPARRAIFERLVAVEDAHVDRWRGLFQAQGSDPPPHAPSMQTRALAWAGRVFGSSTVLPIIVRQETREVGSYLRLARSSHQPSTQAAAMAIATESAEHAQHLSESMGRTGEPWHATTDSGYLRSVIYGFNDGLAAKSEAEVAARQIAVEKEEIRLMPDLEEQELAIILEMKGLAPDRARETAHVMMADPQQALDTKVQEEPGIQPPSVTPLTDGLVTGTTPAFGAMIPLVPFLVLDSGLAIWVSLAVAMLAHFAVGAARSVFTGRGFWTSGRDMFLVGFGVAAADYLIGGLLMTS